MRSQIIDTPVGRMQAIWNDSELLQSCSFASPSDEADQAWVDPAVSQRFSRQQRLQHALDDYFESGSLAWDLNWLDWKKIPEFHRAVLRQCYQIAAGHTLTYGELAMRAGRAKAARAVGGAMARNPWPIIIPCHRVVGAGGRLTGYSGTGGLVTKQTLLDLEARAARNLPSAMLAVGR